MGGWGKTFYFVFTVLQFGLTSAPFIFTKVMRYLLKQRINAIRIACFLDDCLQVASSYKMILFHSNFVKKSLQSQTLIWLGISIHFKNGFSCIPIEKLSAIKNSIVLRIEKIVLEDTV